MIKIKANICTTCPKLTSACSNLARTRTPRIYVFVCLFCSCIVGGKYLLSKLVMESFLFQANHRSVSLRWWPALGIVSAYHMIKKNSIVPHFPTCQAALRGKQAIPTRFQDDLMEQDGQAGDMQGGLLLLPDLDRLLALVVVLLHGGLVHQAARSRLPLCSLSQHLVVPVRTKRN